MLIRSAQFLWRRSLRPISSLESARRQLAPFLGDAGAVASFRRLLRERRWQHDVSRLTDQEVLAQVARLLAAGELVMSVEEHAFPLDFQLAEAQREAPAPVRGPALPAAPEEAEEPAFAADLSGPAQVLALVAAAAAGTPLCEYG